MIKNLLLFIGCVGIMHVAYASKAYTVVHQGVTHDIFQVPPTDLHKLKLFWRDKNKQPYQTITALKAALAKQGKTLVFASNGGIYAADFKPLGLYVENGKRYFRLSKGKGGGNFFMRPNGVFYLTKRRAKVVNTTQYRPRAKVLQAVQSGPLLVEHNRVHPKITAKSASKHIRNGVGVDKRGNVYFALSHTPVNLHHFATLFRDTLGVANALYLDGNISTFYAPDLGRYASLQWTPFVSIIGLVE